MRLDVACTDRSALSAVKKGERIAQLICERICYPELQELQVNTAVVNTLHSLVSSAVFHHVLWFQTLDETERGAGGFGSTGTN